MERIEPARRAHVYRALEAESHGRESFESPASPDRGVFSPGKSSPVQRAACERDAELFASHRSRLLGIAHRMLGSRADAEDLVQDVYIRWHQFRGDIASPIAFLVTITSRLCLDRLRELKRQRAQYPDPCLSETVGEKHMPSPETQLEFSEDVSTAFLAVLERLAPEERVAFLLHDVLDYDYDEMARMLGRTESACRQVIHRARGRLRDGRTRFTVTRKSCERVVRQFLAAIGSGHREAAIVPLVEEVEGMALWINTHFLFDRQDGSIERRTGDRRSMQTLRDRA